MKRLIKTESTNVMELCEDCIIAVDDNNIYYVNKFCDDCSKKLFNAIFKDEIHKHNVITTKQITFAVVFWLSFFIVAVAIMYFFFYIN